MHILSAFFARVGPGSPGLPISNKPVGLLKVATDTMKYPWSSAIPKEVNNPEK